MSYIEYRNQTTVNVSYRPEGLGNRGSRQKSPSIEMLPKVAPIAIYPLPARRGQDHGTDLVVSACLIIQHGRL
ncbi:MAG: hypothetical protein PVG45_09265, partial [Gammaproteobacteria bacterium]